jgi:hypothetical protein
LIGAATPSVSATISAAAEELGEAWSSVSAGDETWSEIAAGSEVWSSVSAGSESWVTV